MPPAICWTTQRIRHWTRCGSYDGRPMPTSPPDHDQRARIVGELDRTMVVEAAAGTGKTTMLIQRMIALLAAGKCGVETLAAVTFTRKAAAEIRARFQLGLERELKHSEGMARDRLTQALEHIERSF